MVGVFNRDRLSNRTSSSTKKNRKLVSNLILRDAPTHISDKDLSPFIRFGHAAE